MPHEFNAAVGNSAHGAEQSGLRLSQHITTDIRNKIKEGELVIGDRLPAERKLAEQYEVSRMAVREALRNLEETGVVRTRKGRYGGTFVFPVPAPVVTRTLNDMVGLGAASVENMIEARTVIMHGVVRLACAMRLPENIDTLRAEFELIRRRPTPDDNMDARIQKALFFNVHIARSTQNPVLVTLVEALTQSMIEIVIPLKPTAFPPIVNHYQEIISGIEANAPDSAALAMNEYLRELRVLLPSGA